MLIFLLFLLVNSQSVWSKFGQPVLEKYVTAKISVDIQVVWTHFILNGILVVDSELKGVYAQLYGDDPQDYWHKANLSAIVTPLSNNTVDIWNIKNSQCLLYGNNVSTVSLPPLSIPSDSEHRGNTTVDGISTSVWRIHNPYKGVFFVDVYITLNTPHNVIRLQTEFAATTSVYGYMTITLTNHNNNKPNPDWYFPPRQCKI